MSPSSVVEFYDLAFFKLAISGTQSTPYKNPEYFLVIFCFVFSSFIQTTLILHSMEKNVEVIISDFEKKTSVLIKASYQVANILYHISL